MTDRRKKTGQWRGLYRLDGYSKFRQWMGYIKFVIAERCELIKE